MSSAGRRPIAFSRPQNLSAGLRGLGNSTRNEAVLRWGLFATYPGCGIHILNLFLSQVLPTFLAMIALASETGGLFAHSLMIIIGTPYHELALATYAFSQSELAQKIIQRTCVVSFPPSRLEVDQRPQGSAVSEVARNLLQRTLRFVLRR